MTQLSKNKIKYIHSLELKKNRKAENVFLAEGDKCVGDLLKSGYEAKLLISTECWDIPYSLSIQPEHIITSAEDIRKASLQQNPQNVIGVFKRKKESDEELLNIIPQRELCLCLDGIQDPGNLGTIIRTADWFGINNIFCSLNTTDAYSPKAIQATMGSIARVNIHYLDIIKFAKNIKNTPIYGTLLDGDNIYDVALENKGLIVMGNEGNGISKEMRALLNKKILIPAFHTGTNKAESLNVSIATAIICAEFRRRCK